MSFSVLCNKRFAILVSLAGVVDGVNRERLTMIRRFGLPETRFTLPSCENDSSYLPRITEAAESMLQEAHS